MWRLAARRKHCKLTVDDQRHAGYDRDSFGFRQTDDDGNGCDVREDVLARDLTDVRYRQHGCKVESGTLADPYTGKTIHFVRGARIARAHGVTPARSCDGISKTIPKSVHADEHAAIDALDGPTRAGHDPMTFTYA